MLHHRHHALASQFRGDSSNVGLSLLQVLQPHVNRPLPNHCLDLNVQTGQQGSNHVPKILTGERNRDVALQLLTMRGKQLLLNLLRLRAVEISEAGHGEVVEVTDFEPSYATLPSAPA